MTIPAALAADLHLLAQVLDDALPGDRDALSTAWEGLLAAATLAVPSYLGLSVLARHDQGTILEISTLELDLDLRRVATSLRFRLGDATPAHGDATIELVLFASRPGAFVDLAADLAWLTGQAWGDLLLDQDLDPSRRTAGSSVTAWSAHNQALGLLIWEGRTPEEAEAVLAARGGVEGPSPGTDGGAGGRDPTNDVA